MTNVRRGWLAGRESVKDHRVNLLLNDLPGLLDGGDALGEMLDALKLEERRQLMAEFSVSSE